MCAGVIICIYKSIIMTINILLLDCVSLVCVCVCVVRVPVVVVLQSISRIGCCGEFTTLMVVVFTWLL